MTIFTRKYEFDSESSDEDISDEELAETCKLLYIKWEEACMVGQEKKRKLSTLLQEKDKIVSTIMSTKGDHPVKFQTRKYNKICSYVGKWFKYAE